LSKRNRFYFRVVVRLGSTVPFSQELNELQEEVKPLWKIPSCPRDFKRTSVEILFREAEFRLDWCAFRLVSCGRLNRAATRKTSFAVINAREESLYVFGVKTDCLFCLFVTHTHVIYLLQNYVNTIACELYYHVNTTSH